MSARAKPSKKYSSKYVRKDKKRARAANYVYNSNIPMVRYPQIEKKFLDWYHDFATVGHDLATVNAGSRADNFLSFKAGGQVNNRIGNKITLRNINIRADVTIKDPSSANAAPNVRCVLVLDKQSNAATASWADVFQQAYTDPVPDTPTGGQDNNLQLQLRNMQQAKRFVVLKDKMFSLNPGGAILSSGSNILVQTTRTLKMSWRGALPVTYAAAAAAIPTSNNILLFFVSDVSTIVRAIAVTRVKFTDL